MTAVEQLVLDYVSGLDDLSPLAAFPRLRALPLENARRVSDFAGLAGLAWQKLLAIHGTLDCNQPIREFELLHGLGSLEVLSMWQSLGKSLHPDLLPVLALKNLKALRLHGSYFATEEYPQLEEGLPDVEGATWGPCRVWAQSQTSFGPTTSALASRKTSSGPSIPP